MDNSEEAEVQFEENQRLLREHMQEVQENKTKLSMSNRERNSRQSISSKLRNSILYGILEMRDVVFSKRMLKSVPRNLCGRYRSSRYWDKFILGFLSHSHLLLIWLSKRSDVIQPSKVFAVKSFRLFDHGM